MSNQDDLKSKIATLDRDLNELYALDDSWRTLGKWPDGVRGSVLHAAASDEEIARAETRFGHKFPPSYKQFLRLHSAWEHFWGDFTLVGTGRPEVQKALDEIAENIEYQTSTLKEKFGGDLSEAAISAWESEEPRNLFLANQLVIGTNFRGFHWVYDTRTRGANDEMKLVYWNISYGAKKPTFDRFDGLIDYAMGEVAFRLEHLKSKASRGKASEGPAGTAKSEAPAKRSTKKTSS